MPNPDLRVGLKPGVVKMGGIRFSPQVVLYPEREEPAHHWLDPIEAKTRLLADWFRGPLLKLRLRLMLGRVLVRAKLIAGLSDAMLARRTQTLRSEIRRHGLTDALVAEGFALIREHARRTLGLYHHKVQLLGGLAMIRGSIAEMETGEGKSLTATLAAGTAALAGLPVHIVTVNDYLAERDAETMLPLYERLGLSVGLLKHGVPLGQRREVYGRDILYASNKEIAFDYLRDRVKLGCPPRNMHLKISHFMAESDEDNALVMQGLHFAIVDEADSVLIDEARTPLILSKESDASAERVWAESAHDLANFLVQDRDFLIHRNERRIELTKKGSELLEQKGMTAGGIWTNSIRREHAIRQALSVQHLFQEGDHYILQDGKVAIVDEYTGRVMGERSWNDGMHQLVEVKERVEVTPRKEVIARMTYQRFFRRYRHLAGMTGTAREVTAELSSVYRLNVVSIPTNVPSRRHRLYPNIFRTALNKWAYVSDRTIALHAEGRPVLIGARSVAASEEASAILSDLGLVHDVLNAKDDSKEAEIIARAGQAGRITVATNLAGRGVDISLGLGVAEKGGLHVILTERHDSKRIDRQLEGRTARRGEPGSCEAILSLEDGLLASLRRPLLRRFADLPGLPGRLSRDRLFRAAQKQAERTHARARRILLDQDRRMSTVLAFSGKPE